MMGAVLDIVRALYTESTAAGGVGENHIRLISHEE